MKRKLSITISCLTFALLSSPALAETPGSLTLTEITDNRSTYPSAEVPRFEKLEITFQVNGIAVDEEELVYVRCRSCRRDLTVGT